MRANASGPVLLTGFEPFGGEAINASWEAVSLVGDTICGHTVEKRLIPVEFGRSGDVVCALMDELEPCCVVAVGEAGGRSALTVERVAVNVMDARMPDNAGAAPHEEPVVPMGADGLFSRLPLEACVKAARAAGVPAAVSDTAGLYVCNQLMYRILSKLVIENIDIPAGFVHVPYTPAQVLEKPQLASMEAGLAAKGIQSVVEAALC